MEDCANHKKEVAGITDMTALAEMIGDLHYETLAEFLNCLAEKIFNDHAKDAAAGRDKLSKALLWTYYGIHKASYGAEQAWKISKPHMAPEEKKEVDHWPNRHPTTVYRFRD